MEESFDKPSFLIYKHDFNSISYFSDELLGLLFRTICEYQNDKKYAKTVIANRKNAKKNSKK